jgi:hypothetical protein
MSALMTLNVIFMTPAPWQPDGPFLDKHTVPDSDMP